MKTKKSLPFALLTAVIISSLFALGCAAPADSHSLSTSPPPEPASQESSASTGPSASPESLPTPPPEPSSSPSQSPPPPAVPLAEETAKQAALDHAGLTAGDVTFTEVSFHAYPGSGKYDVEFYTTTMRYDYELDAATGAILEVSQNQIPVPPGNSTAAPPTSSSTPADPSAYIGEASAKQAALTHAGFTEDQVTRLTATFEFDNGIPEYEVEFDSGGMEYSYDIDATNGTVRSYDKERID